MQNFKDYWWQFLLFGIIAPVMVAYLIGEGRFARPDPTATVATITETTIIDDTEQSPTDQDDSADSESTAIPQIGSICFDILSTSINQKYSDSIQKSLIQNQRWTLTRNKCPRMKWLKRPKHIGQPH